MTAPTRVVEVSGSGELGALAAEVRSELPRLAARPSADVLELLDAYGQHLAASEAVARLEGASFLVFWLRRANLERLLETTLVGGRRALDEPLGGPGDRLRALPAGLVCHWVAGNVPTLPLFSWILALLTKNVALVRVPAEHAAVDLLLPLLAGVGAGLGGAAALAAVRFVHFPRDDRACHELLSMEADCKVVWGGQEAVTTVIGLPRRLHCNEVVFGPKYSLGVIEAAVAADAGELARRAQLLCRDAVVFDQRACSSPQTVFVERSATPLEKVVDVFAAEMEKLARANPKAAIDDHTAAEIYAARATWSMNEGSFVRCSRPADWTVCGDRDVALKTAVQSRTLFLTEVEDLDQILPLLGPRIQTIGAAFADARRELRFAEAAGLRGVSRCVRPGLMNVYDLPWDGRLVLSEMLRWMSIKGG